MARARSYKRKKKAQSQPSGAFNGFLSEPSPPSPESERMAQLARDVMQAEGVDGGVVVKSWSGGFYVTLIAQEKERIVYLFSPQNQRSNLDLLRQAAKDLKSALTP